MAKEPTYRLDIVDKEGKKSTLPLGDKLVKIGRVEGNDLVLEDSLVSRNHATIEKIAKGYQITDPGSSNGTFLNGDDIRKKGAIPLKHNDKIAIDGFMLTFKVIRVRSRPKPKPKPKSSSKLTIRTGPATIPPSIPEEDPPYWGEVPPGLSRYSNRLINYLPEIYQPTNRYENGSHSLQNGTSVNGTTSNGTMPNGTTQNGATKIRSSQNGQPTLYGGRDDENNFMSRYLAIFESVLLPLEWTADGFDLFLHPATAPAGFLPWLASWFDLTFDQTWSEEKRRELLKKAYFLFSRRGTKAALNIILQIYIGQEPTIDDEGKKLAPHTFTVSLPVTEKEFERELIERIINEFKPAHTKYELKFKK